MKRLFLAVLAVFLIAGICYSATLYQTTPAPKITYPYNVGIKVATDTDTPLSCTLTDTHFIATGAVLTVIPPLSVTQTDTHVIIPALTAAKDTVHVDSPILATVSGSVHTDSPLAVNVLNESGKTDSPLSVNIVSASTKTDSPLAVDVRSMPSSAKTDSPLSVNVLNEVAKTDSPLAVNVLNESGKTDSPLAVNVLNEVAKTDSPLAVNVLSIPAITGSVNVDSPLAVNVLSAPAVTGSVTTTPIAVSSDVCYSDTPMQIKGSAGKVYAILVSGIGVTAGDTVMIKNSTDNSGTSLITIVADSANGTWAFYPSVGITYSTGIYFDASVSGGRFTATVVYQ